LIWKKSFNGRMARCRRVLQIASERKKIAGACRQAGSVERRPAVIVAVTPVMAPAQQR
jgi:hypothetical protein